MIFIESRNDVKENITRATETKTICKIPINKSCSTRFGIQILFSYETCYSFTIFRNNH